jgi:nucleoid DNA-binding protein
MPETIGSTELTAVLAETKNITKALAREIFNCLRDQIVQALLDGNNVNIPGLARLTVRATKEKTGRNPKTGESIRIPAGRKVSFKPASSFKKQL